ncbi:MAG: alpha-ketoglutarate-dependent dioxygenase AlkB [Pseudomonadales bacterium]
MLERIPHPTKPASIAEAGCTASAGGRSAPGGWHSAPGGWHYVPNFLRADEAGELLRWLLAEMPWHRDPIRLFGRSHVVPRLVSWCGDAGLCYRYAGQDHPSEGWPGCLHRLRERLALETGVRFNFLLLNRYRSGADRMGWHRDDEPMTHRTVASISLGAERRFLLRPDRERPSVRLDLEPGSLLLMDRFLPHALPATRRPIGERVNLSFRSLPDRK